MAFVGYKTTADAVKALEYFHNTFIDTSRVQVEYARAVKSAQLPRPWSKHSEGSSAHRRTHETPEERAAREAKAADAERFIGVRELKKMKRAKKVAFEKEIDDAIAADPKLTEFMRLMAPRSQQRMWDNQAADVEAERAAGGELGAAPVSTDAVALDEVEAPPEFDDEDDDDDDDEYQEIGGDSDDDEGRYAAGKRRTETNEKTNETKKTKTKDGPRRRKTGREMSDDSESDESDSDERVDDDADDEELDDLDYLRRKSAKNFSDSEDDEGEDGEDGKDGDEDGDEDGEFDSDMEGIDDLEDDPGASEDEEGEDEDEEGEDEDGEEGAERADASTPDEKPKATDEPKKDDEPKVEEVTAEDMEAVAETGRLFVRNLPFTATEEEVAAHFAPYGALAGVFILADKATKRSKGLAYVTYTLPENASRAMEELDGSIFQGRLIHLLPARRPPSADAVGANDGENFNDGDGAGDGNFKRTREERLKRDAGTNRAAWNSLFMRQDTVAAAVAAKYGVSKADLLESGENDVAVRMALGEAQVIADTKDQLSAAGVDPGALEAAAASSGANANKTGVPGVKRSNVAILLKNLPFESEVNELRGLCERFGGVARMVLPDTKTIAVVEWLEPGDARKAFKGLAYKRYRHVPIYVEWAPEGIFTGDQPVGTVNGAPARTPKIDGGGLGLQKMRERDAIVIAKAKNSDDDDDGDDAGDAEATRLFVKGLSFNTTDASLRAHFLRAAAAASGRVLAATVATQKGPGGANLSRGFGFVEFDSPGAARSAKRAMQGKELDGRALRLEISSGGGGGGGDDDKDKDKVPKGTSATKIVVRNVAFEATKRDVQKLFNPFGTLKSCRLPKKFDGSHRGFAFVELSTKREASAALEALAGTHLYGRRLTIERAAESDDVETIREKTAARFEAGEQGHAAAEGQFMPVAKRRKNR